MCTTHKGLMSSKSKVLFQVNALLSIVLNIKQCSIKSPLIKEIPAQIAKIKMCGSGARVGGNIFRCGE